MNKGAHLARLFLSDECQWVEVLYFAGKFDRKPLGVELFDIVGATAPVHQGGPRVFDSVANRCDEAEARNHDATCQLRTPWKPAFSAQPLRPLRLCGCCVVRTIHHRDAEDAEVAQRSRNSLFLVLVDIVIRVSYTLDLFSVFIGN